MANPFNEAFGTLLSAAKSGADGKLKIKNNPTINQINAQDWRFDGDDLILDTPDKKAHYQMLVAAGGGVKRKDNIFADNVDLFKKHESIRNVVVDGKKAYGKMKVGKSKISKHTQVGFNERSAFQESLKRGRDWRSMPHQDGSPAQKSSISAMKKLGIYDPDLFVEFAEWNKRGVEDTLAALPKGMTAGHGKSASKGGPMTARNLYAESTAENYARQNKADAPDDVMDAIGVPRTWEIVVGKWAFNKGLITDTRFAPTEAEKLMIDDDIIESLSTFDWETVLERRKAHLNKLQQPNN